jgi:hypothetical protein
MEDILVATAARPQGVDSGETLEKRQCQIPIPNQLEVVAPNSRKDFTFLGKYSLSVRKQELGLDRAPRSQAQSAAECNAEQFAPSPPNSALFSPYKSIEASGSALYLNCRVATVFPALLVFSDLAEDCMAGLHARFRGTRFGSIRRLRCSGWWPGVRRLGLREFFHWIGCSQREASVGALSAEVCRRPCGNVW